jgi:diacylglycerol kinase (ATP)
MHPLERLVKATAFSWAGLCAAFRHQPAFRQEVAILIVVIPAGLWLGRDAVERALLVSSWLLVMAVELINSAIEAVVDRIGSERHELAGRAKDLGSAAVLCAIGFAITVWVIVLAF